MHDIFFIQRQATDMKIFNALFIAYFVSTNAISLKETCDFEQAPLIPAPHIVSRLTFQSAKAVVKLNSAASVYRNCDVLSLAIEFESSKTIDTELFIQLAHRENFNFQYNMEHVDAVYKHREMLTINQGSTIYRHAFRISSQAYSSYVGTVGKSEYFLTIQVNRGYATSTKHIAISVFPPLSGYDIMTMQALPLLSHGKLQDGQVLISMDKEQYRPGDLMQVDLIQTVAKQTTPARVKVKIVLTTMFHLDDKGFNGRHDEDVSVISFTPATALWKYQAKIPVPLTVDRMAFGVYVTKFYALHVVEEKMERRLFGKKYSVLTQSMNDIFIAY